MQGFLGGLGVWGVGFRELGFGGLTIQGLWGLGVEVRLWGGFGLGFRAILFVCTSW